MSCSQSHLRVEKLSVHFPSPYGITHALDDVSFDLAPGDSLGIVGETGSGKTTIAKALMGLQPPDAVTGKVFLGHTQLIGLREESWQPIRWKRIALAVQGVETAFNPIFTIEQQILEPIQTHLQYSKSEGLNRVYQLADLLNLKERLLKAYPHQLSGGEKQRAMLAMALSCEPDILIMDEPTSGQDVRGRSQLIKLLQQIREETGTSLLFISHDLAAVSELSDQVLVLYAGKTAEFGQASKIIDNPRHPYTWGLLNSYPNMTTTRDLRGIRGQLPNPISPPTGCRFHPRCTQAVAKCITEEPPLRQINGRWIACHLGGLQTLLSTKGLCKSFPIEHSAVKKFSAVEDASLDVLEGEVVAVVGETGSGKTTLARMLVRLLRPDQGTIQFMGKDLVRLHKKEYQASLNQIQYIPQDPFESTNPRFTIAEIVREPLDIQNLEEPTKRDHRVKEVLNAVNLPNTPAFLNRHAFELSGGQLQRVCIARALASRPKLLVADEPVSMLDASEQAKVINLIKNIQNKYGMGLVLISHNLALVRKVADRIMVMQNGKIIEANRSNRLISQPQHEYTQLLLEAAPKFQL